MDWGICKTNPDVVDINIISDVTFSGMNAVYTNVILKSIYNIVIYSHKTVKCFKTTDNIDPLYCVIGMVLC